MTTFGHDGLCRCDQATKCPLGKTGSASRCHQSEFFSSKSDLIAIKYETAQLRPPYYYRIEADGQSVEIGFQTVHELMAYLMATEQDEERKKQLAECLESFRGKSSELHERFDGFGSINQGILTVPTEAVELIDGRAYWKSEASLIHFATVPFIADCGADVPNQRTTTIRGNVTCEACKVDEPRMV